MGRRTAVYRGLRITWQRPVSDLAGQVQGPAGAEGVETRARARQLGFAVALALALALPLRAQDALVRACTGTAPVNSCWIMAQAAAIAQPRLALAAAGGAPLLGNASTLGMRLGSTPRVALQLRASGARLTLPGAAAGSGSSALVSALALEGGVGLTRGLNPAPTVSGVGSIDVLGSLGVVHPGGRFSGSPGSFGVGARLGVLRESFTAPGITLTGMLRRTGGTSFTSPSDSAKASFSHIADLALRATLAKRFLPIATLVGVGLDRASGDVSILPPPCPPTTACAAVLPTPTVAGLTQTRAVFFGDLTWTSLVFNAVAELGWQRGGSPTTLVSPTGYEPLVRKGALFGSLGIRLTI